MPTVSEHRPLHDAAVAAVRGSIAFGAAVCDAVGFSIRPSEGNSWLAKAELDLMRRNTRYAGPVFAVAAFVVAQSCADWIAWDTRTAWWLAVCAIMLSAHAAAIRLERRPTATLDEIRARALWQTAFALVCDLAWCSMGIFLWTADAQLNHMLLTLLLAVSLAGAVVICAVHPATAAGVIVLHAIFLIAPPLLSPTPLDHTCGLLAVVYVSLIAAQAVVLHRALKKMLILEHEHAGLVENLLSAKRELERERSGAVAASRAKSQFLSNMNHELRTPMNAILGFSELIKVRAFGGAVDKYAEYAEIIHQSGLKLLTLIDDMMNLAKIEGGKLSLRESEVHVAQLMADIFEECEPRAAEARISLLRKVTPGLPPVIADERALRQIMANLASNALKFTPAEGCVTLFARLDDDGRMAFGVDDTGTGIAEEDRTHVFERFGRGRHDVTTADKGTGLGLAIVKGFAEAHDGEIKLESTLGAGTRVTAYLPAERVCAADALIRNAG